MNQGALAALLREHASRHAVPGAAVGLLREGAATIATYGVADAATGEPVIPETRFATGSLTKPMVATVIARLAAEGRLSLGDPVSMHVPALRAGGWADQAIVRDLLANRSGLPLSSALEFDFEGHPDEDDGALARFCAEVPAAAPATDFWSYTNVGWCLLGRVIETTAGETWEGAMRRYLFDPTGMRRTTFASASDQKGRASGYDVTPGGAVRLEWSVERAYGPAGATIVSTVPDLLRFAGLHLQDASLAPLRAAHSDLSIYGWLDSWCLGWARFDWGGRQVWGWDGLIGGERSVLRILPDHQAAIVVMANGSTGRAMSRSLFEDLLPRELGINVPPLRLEAAPVGAADLTRFEGVYAWPDRRVQVTATSRSLQIKEAQEQSEARPLDDRVFVVDPSDPDNPTVTFGEFDPAGRPRVLYLMLWGLPRVPG
jgi:CubicO group peptidase (beta-lactamase class C family)